MAYGHGKNVRVYCNGYNLTGYLNTIETPISADTAETSVFGLSSKTYLAGLTDATLSAAGFFDGAASAVDEVMNTAIAAEYSEWVWYPQGDAVAAYGYGMAAINNAYSVSATLDNAVQITVGAQSTVGRERGLSLHALGAEAGSDWTGTTNNFGAASANGGSAYLEVTAVTGDIEISLRHSSDNFAADDTELVAFTNVTALGSQRVTFTGAVKQYVRGIATIGGAETITFNILFCRK